MWYIDGRGSSTGLVNVDWFSLSLRIAGGWKNRPFDLPIGWSAQQLSSTAVWAQRWYILDAEGNKLATFLAEPRSTKVINAECAMLEVANRWLYYDDFIGVCNLLLDSQPCTVSGVSRVDLCCDFELDKRKWGICKRLATGENYVKALRKGVVWWQQLEGCRVPHQISWGGFDSAIHWKLYYKWLELNEGGAETMKPYIVDQWQHAGFDKRCVWRCEVSLTHCNQFVTTESDQRVRAFDWYNDRCRLYSSLYSDKFVVRVDQGHKDKRNDRVVPFLDINEKKLLKYAIPSSMREASDPEKRLAVKLWYELQQGDTQCNSGLMSMLQTTLQQLLERPTNLYAIQNTYELTVEEIAERLNPLAAPSSKSQSDVVTTATP